MSTTELVTPDGVIDAVLDVPSGAGPWPGVVLLHDIAGLTADLRTNTRRLADNGYLAIAPDLFSRGLRCVPGVMRDVMSGRGGRAVRDILAARDRLRADRRCTGRIAVAGFCMGGGFALLVAPQGFDAAAPFYPSGSGDYAAFLQGACPIVASYGRRDPANIGRAAELERVLTDTRVTYDVKTYSGAGHSFANELPFQPVLKVMGLGYNESATRDAWERIFTFFDTHLKAEVED